MSELLSQLSTELCVVKSKKEGGEVSKKADLKRVPGGFELSSMLDKHKFTLDDSFVATNRVYIVEVAECVTADTYTEYKCIPWERTNEDAPPGSTALLVSLFGSNVQNLPKVLTFGSSNYPLPAVTRRATPRRIRQHSANL